MTICIGCLCVILIFLISIFVFAMVITIREKYTLLRNVGKFPLQLGNFMTKKKSSNIETSSKYSGHMYDRHHIRSNPHVRRYQDSF